MQELTIPLDSSTSVPLYEQIYRFISAEIQSGRLQEGTRLPSKRALCAHLGVSGSTVETAYGLLLAEGYILSRPRSGFFVAAAGLPRALNPARPISTKPQQSSPRYNTSTAAIDTSVFPYATWTKLFKEVLYARTDLLQQGDVQGDIELREALTSFLYQYRGVYCSPEQVVVGAGLESLMDILFRLFDENCVLAMEDPGYSMPYRVAYERERRICPIPVDAMGMNVNMLHKCEASVTYVTAAHQFPTGVLMPVSRRMQLLAWAEEKLDRFIIEDDYDSEFRYSSRPMPAMQGLSPEHVIFASTFSRTIAPSIRVAYMVLPQELLKRYYTRFSHSVCSVSRFEQQTLARFLSGGYYARHLRRVGNLYRQRCATFARALITIPGVSVHGRDAGLHFLISHERLDEQEMLRRAAAQGIFLNGLSEYCHLIQPVSSTVVTGFAGLTDAEARETALLLQSAWKDI